ncbi:sugar transferase [Agromyces silvae]|uniref:sugar transferase n=1 Tax=Agromyces silvae TaxID=3388266 RepID=UPI00280AE200|nr:sugar transferase [Agromyces protaetiae]
MSARAKAGRGSTSEWSTRLAARVRFTDGLILVWVVFGTQIGWVRLDSSVMGFSGSRGDIEISYTLVSLAIVVAWMIALELYDTRSVRVLGVGTQEYKGIADSALRLFGLIAIIAFLFKIDVARGYILMAFPLGIVTLIFSRWMWRQWLAMWRQRGDFSSRTLLVGSPESATVIARELLKHKEAGYQVVGACVTQGSSLMTHLPNTNVPVYAGADQALATMRDLGADTVIITSSDEMDPERVRRLSWGLTPGAEHLVVAPSLIDVGGPRIRTRPVANLPLIHVETPKFEGRKLVAKRVFDLIASAGLLLVLSPVLIVVALAVKLTSKGPVLFKQERVGIKGKPFKMLKFRSMVVDAEARLAALQAQRDAGNTVMFKMKDDPRVTKVGRVLRRYSLDELPQLINVLLGSMSLVGPRPPLPREVDAYDQHVNRRFLVKPGITGLWQVSGRSSLPWEETVRLDLYYVENWSLTGDIVILWRTAKAVVAKDGAF